MVCFLLIFWEKGISRTEVVPVLKILVDGKLHVSDQVTILEVEFLGVS